MAKKRKTIVVRSINPGNPPRIRGAKKTAKKAGRKKSAKRDRGRPGITSFGAKSGTRSRAKGYEPLIQREGKLGGPGYTDRADRTRHAILNRCVEQYGYRSCLGSLQVLLRSTELKGAKRRVIEADKKWLMSSYGSTKNPAKAKADQFTREHLREWVEEVYPEVSDEAYLLLLDAYETSPDQDAWDSLGWPALAKQVAQQHGKKTLREVVKRNPSSGDAMTPEDFADRVRAGLPSSLKPYTTVAARTSVGESVVKIEFAYTKSQAFVDQLNARHIWILVQGWSRNAPSMVWAEPIRFSRRQVPAFRRSSGSPEKVAAAIISYFNKHESSLLLGDPYEHPGYGNPSPRAPRKSKLNPRDY